jgi:hypothetical protein
MKNTTHTTHTTDMTTIEKFAAQLKAARNPFRDGKRVKLDDPRMAVYWERLAEDLLRTDEEWDALLAETAAAAMAQRQKFLANMKKIESILGFQIASPEAIQRI